MRHLTLVAHDVGAVGGMERQLADLVQGLRRRGWGVTVIARTCKLPHDPGVRFFRVRGPSRPFLLAYPWFAIAGSVTVARRRRGLVQATGAIVLNRVDTVAIHCCHQVYRPAPNRRGRLFRLHGELVGLLARAGERVCYRVNRPRAFVCVSDGVADEMRAHHPRAAVAIATIHNGIDLAAFAPRVRAARARGLRTELGIDRARLTAAYVGDASKGLRQVLEALIRAPEWDLLVAGRGHVRNYRELAESFGVSRSVHWLGVVRDIQMVYGAADAFVMPSSYETFSLVTFEAAASGLPVIVTPVSGVRELIRDEENGLLIDADPDQIADRLRRLAADPALRARLSAAARESASLFTTESMIAKHDALYTELADRHRTDTRSLAVAG